MVSLIADSVKQKVFLPEGIQFSVVSYQLSGLEPLPKGAGVALRESIQRSTPIGRSRNPEVTFTEEVRGQGAGIK